MTGTAANHRGPIGPLGRFVAGFLAAYAAVAWATYAPGLILVLNGVACSAAAGVCVAYLPVFVEAMRASHPSRGHFLGAGIFLVSLSILGIRVISFVARDLGWPDVYNTDWMTLPLSIGILGALLHLWAPEAIAGRIPRRRWVGSGITVSVGLLLAFVAWYAHAHSVLIPVVLR